MQAWSNLTTLGLKRLVKLLQAETLSLQEALGCLGVAHKAEFHLRCRALATKGLYFARARRDIDTAA